MTSFGRSTFGRSTVLGYPRIGADRSLKRALEAYWAGAIPASELLSIGEQLRRRTWQRLASLGLEALPSNTFSHYDQMLDTLVLLGATPERFTAGAASELDVYFAMARGNDLVAPLPMTKWFDTNYHYLVPEIGPSTPFTLNSEKPLREYREALALGHQTRPVVIGPVTFLLLSSGPGDFSPLDRLDDVLPVYRALLAELADIGVPWIQLDEPALVADRTPTELAAVTHAYRFLTAAQHRPRIFVASYFGSLGEALPALTATPVEAIGLDLVRGALPTLDGLADRVVVAGVVSGRDVWRTDPLAASRLLDALRPHAAEVVVSTSCSLLHVPHDVELEPDLDPALKARLAFADQKITEVTALAHRTPLSYVDRPRVEARQPRVAQRRSAYPVRAAAQAAHLKLPPLPVTTIGSFPQTDDLRAARAAAAAGRIDEETYRKTISDEIAHVVQLQEELGIDVLVHGEPERNDMVQYFAERLDGFAVTLHGWVQSYGSRCTRPSILHGDVSRPGPITVDWAAYAQSLTDKPVKGMLTGPVTIVAWSFVRNDLPLSEVVWQVAQAIHEEVADLQQAGIRVIQVDEPAFRELLPLRASAQPDYLAWAVEAYRHATSSAHDRTQIHTHLCYSEAGTVLESIDALDADVTTIESARSGSPVPRFARGLGPGVYDIHSPRLPRTDEVVSMLTAALEKIPADRLWVNPDCGLKTRTYPQVTAALSHLVAAARQLRG